MASQQDVQVNMRFNADITQAKAAMQELQQTLNTLGAKSGSTGLSTEMQKGIEAAKELQLHLSNAFNTNTGKLDLSMLDNSLKRSKSNITELSSSLLQTGQLGQQAFVSLAQAISTADRPIISINSKLQKLWGTLKNTVNWQISSSVLHGLMSSVSTAYNYVQDLNRSLNDVRIVSGESAENMAQFAVEANKAAKALSSSTLDYTNASLIFYQQGLNAEQVKERANITIKMANVAQESAATVSDQLTAVWNNYAKGSENLEHFADAMVKLGADTASSSDEIAEGLEKFVAIGDTVGLSFDNAAAALATVTATTRQSADVVGTALILRA